MSGPNDEDHEHEAPSEVPTWDETSRADALQVADQVMRAFARPQLDQATWWSDLAPMLTPAATVAYEFVDPAEVPAAAITGGPALQDESSAYLATITVPTNVGDYTVLLARTGAGGPWLAERITPPETAGP